MTFLSPALLWGLLLIPAALAAYVMVQRRRTRYAIRFTNLDLLANLIPKRPAWRRHLPAALYLAALVSLLVSLARPQALVPVPKEQATVVMVMDTSGSMAASDVQPNRMTAARSAGKTFLDQLPTQFRVAIVSFASTTQTLVRPTTDRVAAREALDRLRADGGTAMGDGLVRAIELAQASPATADTQRPAGTTPAATPSLPGGTRGPVLPTPTVPATPTPAGQPGAEEPERAPMAILLLSDGANTAGAVQPLVAARQAQALGIPVYTIALGTPTGALEVQGRRITVPPDEATLRQIAEITGGQYFGAPSARDLQAVYEDIGSRIGYVQEPREVTAVFAAAGALLLATGGTLALVWFNRFP